MCGDLSQAEDLLQESLIMLSKHWHKVRDGHPDAYTRRILYTQNISRWRRRRFEVVSDTSPEGAGVVLTDRWVDYEDVRAALAQVPPRQRAVLVLRYFEDLSEAETAQILGISLGTVKSQVHVGLARMRTELGPDWARSTSTRGPGGTQAPPIEPAGTGDRGVTGAATSSRPDDGAAVTTDGAVAVTTRPPDASDSDPIPLGHGIVMTPIPGWQVVHDRDLEAGADPESTAFISCPVKEGSIFETLTDCEHGWQIWTGWDDVEPPPENPFTSAAVWTPS